jgi:hypothetical protein
MAPFTSAGRVSCARWPQVTAPFAQTAAPRISFGAPAGTGISARTTRSGSRTASRPSKSAPRSAAMKASTTSRCRTRSGSGAAVAAEHPVSHGAQVGSVLFESLGQIIALVHRSHVLVALRHGTDRRTARNVTMRDDNRSYLINPTLVPRCERAGRASHASGPPPRRRRFGEVHRSFSGGGSALAKRRARARVGESEGRSPSDKTRAARACHDARGGGHEPGEGILSCSHVPVPQHIPVGQIGLVGLAFVPACSPRWERRRYFEACCTPGSDSGFRRAQRSPSLPRHMPRSMAFLRFSPSLSFWGSASVGCASDPVQRCQRSSLTRFTMPR